MDLLAPVEGKSSLGPSSSWRSVLPWVGRALLSVVLLGAFAAKLDDPLPAAKVVRLLGWPIVSEYPLWSVSAVASLELWLGAGSLILPRWKLFPAGVALLLAVFSVVLVRLLSIHDAPSCACLGGLFSNDNPRQETVAGLARNAGLIITACWLFSQPGRDRSIERPSSRSCPRGSRAVGGFTLVELLVCIAIIALLIGLALPAIGRARAQASLTASLSTMRQVHVGTMGYVADSADHFPFLATPMRPWERFTVGSTLMSGAGYFQQGQFVLSLVHPHYFDNRQPLEFSNRSSSHLDDVVVSRYDMSHTAFAAPAYWHGPRPPDDLSLYVGMRISDAAFPASKGLFVDRENSRRVEFASARGQLGPWLISRVDGSAAAEPYDPNYRQPFTRPYGAAPIPGMMTTVGGFQGRDF